MNDNQLTLAGARMLIVGASSGIGREVACRAAARGALVAVAARRITLLEPLAAQLGGTAHEMDVTSPASINRGVAEAIEALGGVDVLVCSAGVFPLARVEQTDPVTWAEAFAVNTIGPALVMSAALPYMSDDAVIVCASSDNTDRPPAGTAAFTASKAALDEILRSWRCEHPNLRVIRIGVGPTADTEIMRGADRELLAELMDPWSRDGRVPDQMAAVVDVAELIVKVIATARATETLVAENVQFRPRLTYRLRDDKTPRDRRPAMASGGGLESGNPDV